MIINRIKSILLRIRGEVATKTLVANGLILGKNFRRMHGVLIDPGHCWLITIGDDVVLAPRVHILAHDASTYGALGYSKIGLVKIGNHVFIGADSVVLPGVTIGDNVIIGANSTITKNIPSNVVVAGNPARIICTITEYLEKNRIKITPDSCFDESYTVRGRISPQKKQEMIDKLQINQFGYVK